MGVCEEVIEHITDDAYNRQGEFRGKKAENQLEKRGKEQSNTNQRAVGLNMAFNGVYTNRYKMFGGY